MHLQIGQKKFHYALCVFYVFLFFFFLNQLLFLCYKRRLGSTYWSCLSVLCPRIKPLVSLKINHTVTADLCAPRVVSHERIMDFWTDPCFPDTSICTVHLQLKSFVLHLKVPHVHALLSVLPISAFFCFTTAEWRSSILCYSYFHDKERDIQIA